MVPAFRLKRAQPHSITVIFIITLQNVMEELFLPVAGL